MSEEEIFKTLEKACILDKNCYEVDCLFEKDLIAIRELIKLYKKQQKEIDFYKKEELGYIAGYEDGKRHKQTAVAIKNENAHQELFQKEIARLKEIIEKQRKIINQLLEDMKERANNFSYESEIMWRKIEKAEELLEEK